MEGGEGDGSEEGGGEGEEEGEEKKWKDQDEEYEGRGWVTRGLRNFQSGSISHSASLRFKSTGISTINYRIYILYFTIEHVIY